MDGPIYINYVKHNSLMDYLGESHDNATTCWVDERILGRDFTNCIACHQAYQIDDEGYQTNYDICQQHSTLY